MVRCQDTNPCGRSHYRLHKRRRSGARAPSSLGLIRCSRLHLQISAAQRKPPPVFPSARETAIRLFQKYTQAQLKTMKARQPPFWLVEEGVVVVASSAPPNLPEPSNHRLATWLRWHLFCGTSNSVRAEEWLS